MTFLSALACAALAGLLMVFPDIALASPPVRAPAEIVFENGGRIIAMKADGSERRVLTHPGGRNPFMIDGEIVANDSVPSISPDGSKLVFLRGGWSKSRNRTAFQVVVANRDGSGKRVIWASKNLIPIELQWARGGKSVMLGLHWLVSNIASKVGWPHRVQLVSLKTRKRRTIFSQTFRKPSGGWWFSQSKWIFNFRLSPDGKFLAYELQTSKGIQLKLRHLVTGRTRTLVQGGVQPSFSPDGKTIAFAGSARSGGRTRCGSACLSDGLYTMRLDGGKPTRIVKGEGSISSIRYSPDGSVIAFASDRNYPIEGETLNNEIYTVGSDGSCLTWLTNGSPSSQSPDWGPEANAEFSPGICGQHDRKPLVEFRPVKPKSWAPYADLWAGRQVGNWLLSSPAPSWFRSVDYADCASFFKTSCKAPISVDFESLCAGDAGSIEYGPSRWFVTRRGVPVSGSTMKGKLSGSSAAIGRKDVLIGQTFWQDQPVWAIPTTFFDHLMFVDALRPLTSNLPETGDLPHTQLTRSSLSWLRKVTRTYEANG